jgi:hypothetical protein
MAASMALSLVGKGGMHWEAVKEDFWQASGGAGFGMIGF